MALETIDMRRAQVNVEYELNEEGSIEILQITQDEQDVSDLFEELDLLEEVHMKIMVKILEAQTGDFEDF
tara:strand:- start:26450 stop:26659 length:210 start_codon:yes stop_codon:yes gene_type:complete